MAERTRQWVEPILDIMRHHLERRENPPEYGEIMLLVKFQQGYAQARVHREDDERVELGNL